MSAHVIPQYDRFLTCIIMPVCQNLYGMHVTSKKKTINFIFQQIIHLFVCIKFGNILSAQPVNTSQIRYNAIK